MDDRQLLELAAKAAGMSGWRYASPYMGMVKMIDPTRPETTGSYGPDWNPLTDDGDALRLAVKLNLLLLPYPSDKAVRVTLLDQPDTIVSWGTPPDPCAATRRAIVRAAADIGKAMP